MNLVSRWIVGGLIAFSFQAGALPASAAEVRSGLDGRLVSGVEPLSEGRVSAYLTIDLSEKPVAVSSPSGPDGRYSLDLEPGIYYLTAAAGEKWNWCGQNPVMVTPGERQWIGFSLVDWAAPATRHDTDGTLEGTISGKVLKDGSPLEDVTVSLYFDETDGFRGMGFMRTLPTGPDGAFRMEMVPEGRYYLIARKRASGRGVGPMVKGDLLSWYRFNPIRVQVGQEIEVVLPMAVKRLDKELQGTEPAEGLTGFEGVVSDKEGNPVPGVHVFAYNNPEMGHHKPAALSSLTDEQGRYRIFLPQGGKYYIGAREGYGDNPAPGEMFGHYEGTADHSLVVKEKNYLGDINMIVRKVLAP